MRIDITRLLQDAVGKYLSVDPDGSNGAKGLAPVMGISAGSLSHKVSPTYPGAHCSPEEVVTICLETNDTAPIEAMCMAVGGAFLPHVTTLGDADVDGNKLITSSIKEFGEWLAEANGALNGPPITDSKMATLERELLESMQEGMRLHSLLRARHIAAKPVALREVRAA